jgi:hypothetical protein
MTLSYACMAQVPPFHECNTSIQEHGGEAIVPSG